MIRIAQRKDQVETDGTLLAAKKISPDEMIAQMGNYVHEVFPRQHPYRFETRAQFLEFAKDVRSAVQEAGLPTNDLRVQGSSLRKKTAKDVDIAVIIDDRVFDGQLLKLFDGKVALDGAPVQLTLDGSVSSFLPSGRMRQPMVIGTMPKLGHLLTV